MNERVAIVEDEADLGRLVASHLSKEGFRTSVFPGAEGFWRAAVKSKPDLVLLDIMLPDSSGLDVLRRLRALEATRAVPVILMTAKGEESDRVLGLELGADDYVVKPFSFKELVSRVRAVLRRSAEIETPKTIRMGEVEIDAERYEVRVKGNRVDLTTTEFKLLALLASKIGRVFTRDEILDRIWGHDKIVLDRTVDVHVKNLRQKLGPSACRLVNVRGVGYKVEE